MGKIKKHRSLFVAFIIAVGIIFSSTHAINATSYYGNTGANINNGGNVVKYNSITYSLSKNPNYKYSYAHHLMYPSYSYTIYKDDNNGKHVKVITTNAVDEPRINIKSGWIYYIGISSDSNPGIYKVKTDGTKRTRISSISLKTSRESVMASKTMILKNNYIYYLDGVRKIRRINLDGKNKKTIYTAKYEIGNFTMSGNYIYLLDSHDQRFLPEVKDKIVRVNVDGKNRKTITTFKCDDNVLNILYYKGYLYYENYGAIYRIKPDGTSNKCIVKFNKTSYKTYIIYNDKVYYITNNSLVRCNLNGSSKKTLKKFNTYIDVEGVANNKIYLDGYDLDKYPIFNIKTNKIYNRNN